MSDQGSGLVDLEQFDDFGSPYLFEKHMQRDQIVFEKFRLVGQPPENNAKQNEQNKPDKKQPKHNRNSGESDQGGKQQETEATIKKKISTMCNRPKRTIKNFLNENEDKSLFAALRDRDRLFSTLCKEKDCGKPQI